MVYGTLLTVFYILLRCFGSMLIDTNKGTDWLSAYVTQMESATWETR